VSRSDSQTRLGFDVGNMNDVPLQDCPAHDCSIVGPHRPNSMKGFERRVIKVVMGCHRDQSTIIPKHDSVCRPAKIDGTADDRLKYRLNVSCRAADHLEHVSGGGLLLERFTKFVEQPRVLDGDHGLGGEVLDQFDLLVGEAAYLLPIYANSTNKLIILQHR